MKEEKTKNEKPKNHIVYFFSFPAFSFGVFMVSISPGNENKKQDSPFPSDRAFAHQVLFPIFSSLTRHVCMMATNVRWSRDDL